MKRTVAVLAMVLVSAIAPVSAAAATAEQQAYSGTHVAFDAGSNAVVDYTVGGTETVDAVRVQSQSSAESNLGLSGSAGLEAATALGGAAVSVETTADSHASMTTDSGATIEAHDNGYGSLVVTADEQSQYVALNLSGDASAEQASEKRGVFTAEDGTTSTAMVVGEGNVTVTESGNLTASVAQDSRLVVRNYAESRTEADETEERMIVNGTAAASVHVMEQSGEAVTDVVTYSEDTTVEVTERAEGQVTMTAERSASEGRVVLTHVSESTFESAEDVQVEVDSEAAAQASSYTEIRQATNGGDTSKYMVQSASSASASAESEVVVGINHFSTREVTMTGSSGSDGGSGDGGSSDGDSNDGDSADGDDSGGDSNDTTTGNGPGFGVVAAVLALVGAALLAARRRP